MPSLDDDRDWLYRRGRYTDRSAAPDAAAPMPGTPGPAPRSPAPQAAAQVAPQQAAAPQRFGAGQHISMFVTGARADAGVWQFNVLGVESIDVAGTPVRTLHVLREPRKPRDSRLEAWLDPARQYAPAKARMSNEGADASEALDLLLQPD